MQRIREMHLERLAAAFVCALTIGCAKPTAGCARPTATTNFKFQPPPVDSNNSRPFDVCRSYLIAMAQGDSEKAQSLRSRFFRKWVDADPEAAAFDLAEFQKSWAGWTDSGKSQISFSDKETHLWNESTGVWRVAIGLVREREGQQSQPLMWREFAVLEDGAWRIAHHHELDSNEPAEEINPAYWR